MIAAVKPQLEAVLLLVIDGTSYTLELLPPSAFESRRIGLAKVGSKKAPYVVTSNTQGQTRCTCPGFAFRSRCKHLRALGLVGLL